LESKRQQRIQKQAHIYESHMDHYTKAAIQKQNFENNREARVLEINRD
jgi:hypothetical protein